MKKGLPVLIILSIFSFRAGALPMACQENVRQSRATYVDPDGIAQICEVTNGIITNDVMRAMFARFAAIDFAGQIEDMYTSQKKECKRINCGDPTIPELNEYSDLFFTITRFIRDIKSDNPVPVDSDCNCHYQNARDNYGNKTDEKIEQQQQLLNARILEAAGRHFVNDLGNIIEDAQFFLSKTGKAFSESERAKKIQCEDPSAYNKVIEKVCAANGITDQDFIRQRKNYLINSVDGGKSSFEDRLLFMARDAQTVSYTDASGKTTSLARYQFDDARIGLAHNHPLGKVADEILKKLILHRDSDKKLHPFLKHTTAQGLLYFFEKNNSSSVIKEFGFSDAAAGVVQDTEKLKEAFRFLMNTHPGFMQVMQDVDAYQKLKNELRKNPEMSVLNVLETKPSVLEDQLAKKCENLQKKFARIVCTKDEDLVANVTTVDLRLLINTSPVLKGQEEDIQEFLLCRDSSKMKEEAKLKGLSGLFDKKMPARQSDYLERLMEKDVTKHQNLFSKSLLMGTNEVFKAQFEQAAEEGRSISEEVQGPGILSKDAFAWSVARGESFAFNVSKKSREEAISYLEQFGPKNDSHKEVISSSVHEFKAQGDSNPFQMASSTDVVNYINPYAGTPQPQYSTTHVTPARKELKSHLSRSYKEEEVSEPLKKLPNKDVEELNRIKNSPNNILAQTLRDELKRMESLQAQIKDLENKLRDSAESQTVIADNTIDSTEENFPASENRNSRKASREPASISPVAQTFTQTDSGAPLERSVSSVPVSSSLKEAVAYLKEDPGHHSGILVISAGGLAKPLVDQKDINQEVRKFVEDPAFNINSIEDLKSRGILIRYSVIENNQTVQKEVLVKYENLDQKTRELIEYKFAIREKERQVSKLAVLKMIMNQAR